MKISKNSLLVVLIAIAGNVHGMDQKPSWKKHAQWLTTVGEVALGLKPVSTLMAQKSTKPSQLNTDLPILEPNKPSDLNTPLPILEPKEFTDLPKDMQNQIIGILLVGQNAHSYTEAAQTINSLAQVNKELNTLINDQQYTVDLVRYLMKKFNVKEAVPVMRALGARYGIEQNRFKLIREINTPREKIKNSSLEELSAFLKRPEISKNIDLNQLDGEFNAALPLHDAVLAMNFKKERVLMLINAGANPNLRGKGPYAKTPLKLAQEFAARYPDDEEYQRVIELLKEYTK